MWNLYAAQMIWFLNLAFQVFLPALSFSQHKDANLGLTSGEVLDSFDYDIDLPSMPGEAIEYHSIQLIRDEFLMNIQKFASSIQRTMQQLYLHCKKCNIKNALVKHLLLES